MGIGSVWPAQGHNRARIKYLPLGLKPAHSMPAGPRKPLCWGRPPNDDKDDPRPANGTQLALALAHRSDARSTVAVEHPMISQKTSKSKTGAWTNDSKTTV